MFLQIWIVLTGNFNFTNLLMVTILLSLLDDQFFYPRRKPVSSWNFAEKALNFLIYAGVIGILVNLYSLKLNGTIMESNIGNLIIFII